MFDTVHILGKGDGWDEIKNVPKGSVVFGCNDAFLRTPEVTHAFHMHDLKAFYEQEKTHSSTKLCMEYAKDHPDLKIYTTKAWKRFPQAEEYPLHEIVEHFKTCYFTSSIEYMIAYALWKGVKTLKFYGCNMTVKFEYEIQKAGMEYWIGVARGMGVNIQLQPKYTSLLKSRSGLLYGYNIKQWKTE